MAKVNPPAPELNSDSYLTDGSGNIKLSIDDEVRKSIMKQSYKEQMINGVVPNGKYEGMRWTRVPSMGLRSMVNRYKAGTLQHEIAKAILKDRDAVDSSLNITITAHAIDRFSIRHISEWVMWGEPDQGIHNYMMNAVVAALSHSHGKIGKDGKLISGAVIFVVEKKDDQYIVVTVL